MDALVTLDVIVDRANKRGKGYMNMMMINHYFEMNLCRLWQVEVEFTCFTIRRGAQSVARIPQIEYVKMLEWKILK